MKKSDIKQLQEAIHANAVEKGFWDCPHCDMVHHCIVCEGGDLHANQRGKYRNDGESIALIHSELSEALECLRDGTAFEFSAKSPHGWDSADRQRTNLAEELADVVIRVMDFAESKGIDLGKAIDWKMAYNAGRPHKQFAPSMQKWPRHRNLHKYPTPTARGAQDCESERRRNSPSLAAVVNFLGGQMNSKVNPAWRDWLMGWPIGWTALEPMGTGKFRSWLLQHGSC